MTYRGIIALTTVPDYETTITACSCSGLCLPSALTRLHLFFDAWPMHHSLPQYCLYTNAFASVHRRRGPQRVGRQERAVDKT